MMSDPAPQQRPWLAFLFSVPIAVLGGLIGLGGAEFRLPVLAGLLDYPARRAITLNLAISLVTVTTSLLIRSQTLPVDALAPLTSLLAALILGALLAAFAGTSLARWLSSAHLERLILVLLVTIGLALIVESFLPQQIPALVPDRLEWRVGTAIGFGLAIGLVSSLLGVAGGELIIPTLVFAYGVDIKTAGTASLIVSLPTVLVGVLRYARHGAYTSRSALRDTVAPMSAGSVVGALLGGVWVGVIPVGMLKLGLGLVLGASAIHMFRKSRTREARPTRRVSDAAGAPDG